MNRLRKLSKVFHKESQPKATENYGGTESRSRPTYRGTKPLTVSDIRIHSDSPLTEKVALQDWCDELGARRPRTPPRRPDLNDAAELTDILDDFPEPPPFKPVLTDSHPDGTRFYFPNDDLFYPNDDLLPPPPDKVLQMIKERERTRNHAAHLEQQRTLPPASSQETLANTFDLSPSRRPLYANPRLNMSTHSLGANARLKAGPVPQRAVVQQQTHVHGSSPQRAYPVTPPLRLPPRPGGERKKLPTLPEGERKRLRSVPTPISRSQRSAANEELYHAYSATLQGRPRQQI
ncbi:hypothetical protein B0H11DRAFT_102559 [Mycena galericulata]|nr:hypothetical protein B0H11DRAFT_102559 [Mycena galericulata]